jgi:hypothetical protein
LRWDRGEARYALACALGEAGLLPAGQCAQTLASAELSAGLIEAVHGLLARSASAVLLVQPENVLGLTEANHIPGTVDEHPNLAAQAAAKRRAAVRRPARGDSPQPRVLLESTAFRVGLQPTFRLWGTFPVGSRCADRANAGRARL